jgi:hypothetical protein
VLGLAYGATLQALVTLAPQPAGTADALIAAARRSGARLVFAGGRPRSAESVDAGDVPGSHQLLGSIRRLQADGAVVLLVSDQPGPLANADCGVGVAGQDFSRSTRTVR